jgi:hypothetical protein
MVALKRQTIKLQRKKIEGNSNCVNFYHYKMPGSAKANRREPKTGLGRVFNYKLGCSENVHVIMYTDAHPYL